MSQSNVEQLFLDHVQWVEKVAHIAARRYGLFGDEATDVESRVKIALMKDDYAIFRDFKGDSSLKTYLATWVGRLVLESMRESRGRWRPSAAAMRLGTLAVRLETLVYRDGYTVPQAITKLQTSEAMFPEERELLRLLRQLPQREALRPPEIEPVPERSDRADPGILKSQLERQRADLHSTLEKAIASLPEEDQVVIRLHFYEGLSVADIARALHIEQKPLYRRIERLASVLRGWLEMDGVQMSVVASFLDDTGA